MGLWDFLRELPVIDDLVDLWEAGGALLDDSDTGEVKDEDPSPKSRQLDGGLSSSALDYTAFREEMYWTEVGDTGQNTREWLLEQYSQVPVEKDSSGKILSGRWLDPHTGFTSSYPADFDIDHRMPFAEIVESYPEIYDLPREEQLAIYNDLDNLQVIHDDHNIEKGAQSGEVHASYINDEEFRDRFLENYRNYKEALERKFSR